MKRVVGLGACVFDTLIEVSSYPAEDTKKRADSVFFSGGGPVANALVVMSRLGLRTSVIGSFADDEGGRYLIKDFAKYGVDTSAVRLVGGAVSFTSYVILAADKKTRTCVFDRGTVRDDPSALNLAAIDGADVLHLDGNYLHSALAAAKYARSRGITVSLDAGGLYEGIEQLLPLTDILIPSAEFALGFTKKPNIPSAMAELYEKYRPSVLVVTDGSRGGCYFEGGAAVCYSGVSVNAVDTNGAGDTFHGAFLAAHCQGRTLAECCNYAAAVAAFKCTYRGVRGCPFESIADQKP